MGGSVGSRRSTKRLYRAITSHSNFAQVRTGSLTLNDSRIEFGAPFGGYKESGIGREFGPEGLSSFLE